LSSGSHGQHCADDEHLIVSILISLLLGLFLR